MAAVAGYCAEVPKHGACALISESAVIDYYHHHRQASSAPPAACQSLGLCALEEPYQSQMRSGTNLSFDLRVAKGYGPRGYSTVRVSAVVNGNGGQPLPELEAAASLNFTYRSPFLHRWQDRYLYSTVLDLGEELSATLNIGGAAVNVSLPAEELSDLRLACVRSAHACGMWDTAHAQLRLLCLADRRRIPF